MSARDPIRIWDRRHRRYAEEKVYGEGWLRRLYENPLGRGLAAILAGPGPSMLMGVFYDSRASVRKIAGFVETFEIPMDDYVEEPWASFNQFFVRRFRRGRRTFEDAPDRMPAFAEGRYLAWRRVVPESTFPVKGAWLRAVAVLGGGGDDAERWIPRFEGGPVLLARLCPVDYHRYHYPDRGTTAAAWRIPGRLHSVNPVALAARGDILCTNERRVAILETERFGLLAYVEVGAMGVGRIEQTHPEGRRFEIGDEKGMFRFGASTVIVFGEPGRWVPDDDLLDRTAAGEESLVRLGEAVARRGSA